MGTETEPTVDVVSETPDDQVDFGTLVGLGHPDKPEGEPVVPESVDASEDPPASPQGQDKGEEPPPAAEDKPEPERTVNFDGFADDQKRFWERLLEGGHATPDDVEKVRQETLRWSDYTKKTMAVADDRKALAEEKQQWRDDRDLLEKIRQDDRLHAAWLKLSAEGADPEASGDDDLVDVAKARELFRAEREAERKQAEAQQSQYSAKQDALVAAIEDSQKALAVTPEVMAGYLKTEQDLLPAGVDPILSITPDELRRRILVRHEAETAKAEAARLREELTQRTQKAARTAKQSLPPAPRVSVNEHKTLIQQTAEDLGMDPAKPWSEQVTGLGW